MLLHTKQFQAWFWHHQHPPTCHDKQFFLMGTHNSGIGSAIHVLTEYALRAMALGHILLEMGRFHFSPPDCLNQGLECYFLPLANCTVKDVPVAQIHYGSEKDWTSTDTHARLPFPPYTRMHKSWWRAQFAAYIARPTPKLSEYLIRKRQELFPNGLARHTIGIHVRHGDKFHEANPQPLPKYMRAAMELRLQRYPDARHVWLSTEDPLVIQEAEERYSDQWQFNYTNFKRVQGSLAIIELAQQIGIENTVLHSMLNLFLAVETAGGVGTLSSNWCRLIHELRATWAQKANSAYISVDGKAPCRWIDRRYSIQIDNNW
eukprot:NODE_1042_length_1690_cov_18.112604_g979_i0.p1 GENE.NODE_1042_length_1690_cov_18.112604_g979_i0~~NODE_1042_length_1690_cov_18.112604_g979_i0.p1  ORF type:complete len:318 (+),score=71.86 NODE_1042_length_1690_cov_18.112604_g979_i0:544-1497(+)